MRVVTKSIDETLSPLVGGVVLQLDSLGPFQNSERAYTLPRFSFTGQIATILFHWRLSRNSRR